MKHLTIEVAEIEGAPAAFLHSEPLAPSLPEPQPLPIPEHADAGHIAAMSLYRSYGEDAMVTISPGALDLLEPDFIEKAAKRGVYTSKAEGGSITIASDDGSHVVEIRLPVEESTTV